MVINMITELHRIDELSVNFNKEIKYQKVPNRRHSTEEYSN